MIDIIGIDFSNALLHLTIGGQRIKRTSWKENEYIYYKEGVILLDSKSWTPSQEDILAKNWIVV
jgi:hypothetical protein